MREAAQVKGLLDQLLQGLGLDERFQQCRALVIWEDVVGPQIAGHTKPHKVRDGVLEVSVDQPTWMQQLHLMKPQLLAKLNAQLDDAPLKDIFLRRGKVGTRAAVRKKSTPPAWQTVELDDQEQKQITDLLTTVKDPEMRQELEKFLTMQARLSKARREG
jgi:hypothetical protein